MAYDNLYTEITEEVLNEFIGINWMKQKHKSLDFSSSVFFLSTLEGTDFGLLNKKLNLNNLERLDLSNNNLQEVDNVLNNSNGFDKLKYLNLKNNFLYKCNLELCNLIELNLSKNELVEVPFLYYLPQLQVIDLSHNQINGDFSEFTKCLNLRVLNISHNNFDIYPSKIQYDIQDLSSLPNLQNLEVSENPFSRWFIEYKIIFLKKLTNLKYLDGLEVDLNSKEAAENYLLLSYEAYDKLYYGRKNDGFMQAYYTNDNSMDFDLPEANIFKLNALLEEELASSNKAVLNSINFYKLAEIISNFESEKRSVCLWHNIEDTEDARNNFISTMLHNAMLLIERSQNSRVLIMRGIGKLCVVPEGQLGKRCIELLRVIINGNIHCCEEAVNIITQVVIPEIENRALDDPVSKTILSGFAGMPEKVEFSNVLRPLIRQLVEFLQEDPINEDLTAVLAIAVITEENAVEATGQGAPQIVCEALLHIELPIDNNIFNAYLNLLKIAGYCSRFVRKAANYFYKSKISTKVILPQIRDIIGEREETMKMSVSQSKLWSALAFAQIGIIQSNDDAMTLACNSYHLIDLFLVATKEQIANPLVLAVSLTGIETIFKNQQQRTLLMKYATQEMKYLVPLLQYLGGVKYKYINQLGEYLLLNTDNINHLSKPPQIKFLHNPYVFKVFISIAKIIYFFLENLNDPFCNTVNNYLHQHNAGSFIFKCLDVPNDEVKLEILKLIALFPLDNINSEDVEVLITLISNFNNPAAGRVDEIMTAIISLLIRFLDAEGNTGIMFRDNHVTRACEEVIYALLKNSSRRCCHDSRIEARKTRLSVQAVLFLRISLKYPEVRHALRSDKILQAFKTILKNEELYNSPENQDIVIERTWIGNDISYLLATLSGAEKLLVNRKIAFRIISKIGDVLEGRSDLLDYGKDIFLRNLCDREVEMWNDKKKTKNIIFLDDNEYHDRELQHNSFVKYKGTKQLLAYLAKLGLRETEKRYNTLFKNKENSEYWAGRLKGDKEVMEEEILNKVEDPEEELEEENSALQNFCLDISDTNELNVC